MNEYFTNTHFQPSPIGASGSLNKKCVQCTIILRVFAREVALVELPPLEFVPGTKPQALTDNNIRRTNTLRSPSMAWERMIASASTPSRELRYLAIKQLIHSTE